MMPGLDGIQTTEILRRTHNIPVIMLSAKSEDIDKIDGLTAGADDYMTKPFQPAELIARVKSQLRRYTSLGGMYQNQTPAATVYQTGELIVNDASKTVTVDGEPVSLTPREYGILCFLTQHAGQVFSISQIYEAVWQEPAYNSENTVAVHIRRIREKIEINPKEPKYLKVVWGIGYKMENFTRNSWVKAVCWLLIFVMTAVSAGMTIYAAENAQKNNLNDLSSYSTYSLSDVLTHEQPTAEYLAQQLYFPISNLYTVGETGTTEESIEKNVTPADLLGELTSEYYQSDTWESDEPEQSYDASAPTLDDETVSAVMAALASDTGSEYYDISDSAFQAWLTHHPEVYASCRARYISAQLQSLTDTQKRLEGLKNSFDYYLTNTVTGDCFTSRRMEPRRKAQNHSCCTRPNTPWH